MAKPRVGGVETLPAAIVSCSASCYLRIDPAVSADRILPTCTADQRDNHRSISSHSKVANSLLNRRMPLAERALRAENVLVSALALSLGYTSESAFSNAFKRTIGMAPKRYRDAARLGVSSSSTN